jgi:hypothetical protein
VLAVLIGAVRDVQRRGEGPDRRRADSLFTLSAVRLTGFRSSPIGLPGRDLLGPWHRPGSGPRTRHPERCGSALGTITTIAGTGVAGFSGDRARHGGTAGRPVGGRSQSDEVLIADVGSARVRRGGSAGGDRAAGRRWPACRSRARAPRRPCSPARAPPTAPPSAGVARARPGVTASTRVVSPVRWWGTSVADGAVRGGSPLQQTRAHGAGRSRPRRCRSTTQSRDAFGRALPPRRLATRVSPVGAPTRRGVGDGQIAPPAVNPSTAGRTDFAARRVPRACRCRQRTPGSRARCRPHQDSWHAGISGPPFQEGRRTRKRARWQCVARGKHGHRRSPSRTLGSGRVQRDPPRSTGAARPQSWLRTTPWAICFARCDLVAWARTSALPTTTQLDGRGAARLTAKAVADSELPDGCDDGLPSTASRQHARRLPRMPRRAAVGRRDPRVRRRPPGRSRT